MKVSVVLPIFNVNSELVQMTERCILSMAQDKPDELIVVDDGSHIEFGTSYFTDLMYTRITRHEDNEGYTKSVNDGLKTAKGDVLIIGNNDLLFPENWLEGLLIPLARGFDIASVQVVDKGQQPKLSHDVTEGDKFGSLWAMTRKVYKKLGGLDEGLGRGYFTDLDYQKRAEKAGFRVGKYWGTIVNHFPKSTFKIIDPEDKFYFDALEKYKEKWGKVD